MSQQYGRQIALDQQGGDPSKYNAEDDNIFLREGGQTDYKTMYERLGPPFDNIAITKRDYETRFVDIDIQPVPIAVQEDRSLLTYDYLQKQYNPTLSAGGTIDTELDVVEAGWQWFIERVALFGTATGFLQLFDGSSADNTNCFATQAGVATLLGGVQSVTGVVMTSRTPLRLKAIGADANAAINVGVWYRKAKWVWTPPHEVLGPAGYSDVDRDMPE